MVETAIHQVRWCQDGREVNVTFGSKAAATNFRGEVDAADPHYPEGWIKGHGWADKKAEAPELTLRDGFPRAIAARPSAASGTKENYRRVFARHVSDEFQDMLLSKITKEMAGAWVAGLVTAKSAKTAHNIHGLISSVVKQTVEDGLVDRNVFVKLGPDLGPSRSVTILEPEDFDVLHSCFDPPYDEFTEWLYKSGMRFSEAIGLQWRDIDFRRGLIRVERAWTCFIFRPHQPDCCRKSSAGAPADRCSCPKRSRPPRGRQLRWMSIPPLAGLDCPTAGPRRSSPPRRPAGPCTSCVTRPSPTSPKPDTAADPHGKVASRATSYPPADARPSVDAVATLTAAHDPAARRR